MAMCVNLHNGILGYMNSFSIQQEKECQLSTNMKVNDGFSRKEEPEDIYQSPIGKFSTEKSCPSNKKISKKRLWQIKRWPVKPCVFSHFVLAVLMRTRTSTMLIRLKQDSFSLDLLESWTHLVQKLKMQLQSVKEPVFVSR